MKDTIKKLRDNLNPLYGRRETEAIIKIIFHYLKGWNTTDMLIHSEDILSEFTKNEIDNILNRLVNYEPIQYITGEGRFHGLNFKVTRDVLIPRPETEELVDIIIDDASEKEDLDVLDVGTGSGCIAISLAKSLRFPKIDAIDISEKAIKIASENASDKNVKINFIRADIFKWMPCRNYNIIVSNPPYITDAEKVNMEKNVLDYEPALALFVPDSNPLKYYKRIIEISTECLEDKGYLYFEINPRFAKNIKDLIVKENFEEITIIKDSYGKERFIKARK